ncbi:MULTISPECIES: LacI family DNA-binding transcriptional regulator [unclassified Microbacterium]|uniref:LacI family DNA-binding transcriptional regulator n=1 Tax=unclassified Microbacterium TaxID=2609290 RepID=UPI001601A5AC|nr:MULTISPECIES: LacI family DNA-binding transcriptional regulator [unclassified Microbacterium]MBT2484324.1 LacI family DNA-binding transcriptional regulator [Microbacterium sp. ISL-108]
MVVTSRDVARLAGVSQPTVSRALRDDSRVSDATKVRVREAAQLLGYVPSEAGRALSSGRTRRIGLLLTDLDNQFYSHIIAPVHRQLEALGYQLMLHTESADNDTIVERLLANGLDGVILATTTVESAAPLRLKDRGLPFVYFNRTAALIEADATVVDPIPGYRQAVDRSVELGHRRIGAVLGPSNTSTAQARESALRAALLAHGLSLAEVDTRRVPYSADEGEAAARSILEQVDRPTLLFCGNDVVAYGVLNAAHRAGLRVPEDLSVIGFDDLPEAAWPIIDLATVGYDISGMAVAAADLIVRRIEDREAPIDNTLFGSEFVPRRTLSAAPVR